MSGNSFGKIFRLTTFGESHGPCVGGVIEGCPAGVTIDNSMIQKELDLRRPGNSLHDKSGASQRKETDMLEILSGVFGGKTLGTPIAFCIKNNDQRSHDYDSLKHTFRPGHADCTYTAKYGIRDHRGGGRSSARETAARVAAGGIAGCLLRSTDIDVQACTIEFGGISSKIDDRALAIDKKLLFPDEPRPFFAPCDDAVELWQNLVKQVKHEGDSVGGIVRLYAFGLPAGLGEPVFDGLDARIAAAILSIGAVKGIEFGSGFMAAKSRGSINNDQMLEGHSPSGNNNDTSELHFASNNSGGILGGISTGQPLVINVAIKPIPSITMKQQTVTDQGKATTLAIDGRHDISAIPRIIPVLKAMLSLSLADFMLIQRSARI